MGVIFVKDPQTGIDYSVNIAGSSPTESEKSRINKFLSDKRTQAPVVTQQSVQPVQQEAEGGFGTAVGMGIDQLQKAYGSSLEGIGSISGLTGLENYGQSVIEANEQQIAEKAQTLTQREDIDSFGDALSFYTETLGQQVPQLGTTLAGAGAGSLIGGPIGAIVGGALANIPYFYGDNREAQKDAIDRGLRTEMSEGTAFLSALPQAALDSIADRLLIGKVLNPSVIRSGGIFTRAAKGIGVGTIAEVPTEIGQEVINRYQAGLPIADEEAFKVYEDVAIAAGLTGGTVRGATNVIGGDIRKEQKAKEEEEAFKQLQEDAEEDSARTLENINRIKESEQREDEDLIIDPVEEQEKLKARQDEIETISGVKYTKALPSPSVPKPQDTDRLTPQEEMIALGQAARESTLPFNPVEMSELPISERILIQNARRVQGTDQTQPASLDEIRRILGEEVASREAIKQKPLSGGTSRFQPVENKSFTQDQFDRAVEEIKGQKKYTFPAIQKAIRSTGVSKVPRSMVLDVRDEMVNRGILRRSDKSRNGYEVEPDVEAVSDEISSYRKTVSDINKSIQAAKKERVGVLEAARRAQQLERNPRKARELNLRADQIEGEIAKAEQNKAEVEQRIEQDPLSRTMPTTENPKTILPSDVATEETTEGQRAALAQSVLNYDRDIKLQKQNLAKLKRQAKKAKLPQVENELVSEIEADIEKKTYLRDAAQSRLEAPSSPVQVAPEKAEASSARSVSSRAANTTRKSSFNARRQQVFNSLRQRLTRLGLPDVNLTAEKIVAPELLQGDSPALVEGVFSSSDSNKIISLSMEVVDPTKSPQEQFDVLKSVMNHEVIHALKNLGLFSDAEWNSLRRSVAERKYVHIKNGKPVERKYTYLDRAKSMYTGMGLNDASIEEEAIAEMFRDYADGKIKIAGRPRTLFERIKDFFGAIFGANQDAGFNSVEDIFDNVRSGKVGGRERVAANPEAEVEAESRAFSLKRFTPELPMAPPEARAHKLPYELLIEGNGQDPIVPITQKFTPANADRNNSAIELIMENNPDAMMSVGNWAKAMQEALGGDFIPAPPLVGIEYSQNPQVMADKLKQLTPELKNGVDEGFAFVDQIRDIYESGNATPRMTMDLFVWGILSRGAGPVQQEGAFIDVIDSAYPILEKATREPLTDDDVDRWMTTVSSVIPEGSPGKQVTMNVNAAAKLVKAMSEFVGDSNRTVIDLIHEGMSDPNTSAASIRDLFLSTTEGAGIDNKVLSFILLVGGKDDVLVMDRIQGRHLWDDGRYGGANIYDGIGPNKEGLNGIFRGPRGILTTRILEDGMRKNVQKAYELAGRPEDASLGRWHWETWVIEGEQVVNHGTLQAIINGSPIGTSVTEGKTDTFSSGMTYIRGQNAPVVEYPLSDGGVVYMSPTRMKEFEAFIKNPKNGVIPKGFKVTARADIPWYERKEVDREKLDNTAREYENAKSNGAILRSDERTGEGQDASRRGNSPIDRRYTTEPEGITDYIVTEDETKTADVDEESSVELFNELLSNEETTNETKFSVAPTSPNAIVNRIVDGKPTPVFGSIFEKGKLVPVVLPAGNHYRIERKDGSINEGGKGLYHIEQRRHDKELERFSYTSDVRKIIGDIMDIWKSQGREDGSKVISIPNRDGFNLEWIREIPENSPPITLVLKERELGSGYVFDVVTMYMPDIAQKDRAVDQRTGRTKYSIAPTKFSLNTTAGQIFQKEVDLNYARASNFLSKGLGIVVGKDKAQNAADKILTNFQDRMLPVGRMIQDLKAKGLTIVDAMDTYLKEELFHGIVGSEITKRENTIYKSAVDAVKLINISKSQINNLKSVSDRAANGRGFVSQAIETSGSDSLTLVDTYLYAKHAKERNAYVRSINPNNDSGSGMTDAEANAILTWFSNLDNNNSVALGSLDRAVREIVKNTNETRVNAGLIPTDFDEVQLEDGSVVRRSSYDFYVPLRGKIDPDNDNPDPSRPRRSAPYGVKGREDPRVTGRYDYATNILATTINQNQNSVSRGERNIVGQSFLKLLRADPEKTREFGTILETLPKSEQLRSGRVVKATDPMAFLDPFIYTVKENGQDVYVRLEDERIAKALKGETGYGSGPLDYVLRGMGKVNRYLSNINTSYNPEFFITNLLRDLQTAGVNVAQFNEKGLTTQVIKDLKSALLGIKRSIRNNDDSSEWSKIYKDFVEAGGQNATNQMNTISDQMEDIQGILGDISDQGVRGKWNSVKNSFIGKKTGSLLSMVENYNTIVENGIRVSTYKSLLDRGFSRERAAQAARNVTVNFAKGGEYKQFMNAFYLFYNASLQGSFALLNAALRSKKVQKLWGGVIAAGFLQDQLNAVLSEEDEDGKRIYDKIPDYILEHNLILPDPFGFTERSYIAIPMPYGLNMAHNIGRATSQVARGGTTAGKGTSSIVGTIVDTINPIGGTESFANLAAPTVADPFIDVLENEDFAKKPIYKEGFPGDRGPDSQRYWSTTNPSAVWVSNTLNNISGGTSEIKGFIDVSPDVLNFWLEYATGGVGRFVQRTAELPVRVATEGFDEEIYREVPFIRKVIGSVSDREDYGSFIEKRDRILSIGDELRAAAKSGDRDRILRTRQEYPEEVKFLPRIKAIDSALTKISRQMNAIKDNKRIPDTQKELLLEKLDEKKQSLIARANKILADF